MVVLAAIHLVITMLAVQSPSQPQIALLVAASLLGFAAVAAAMIDAILCARRERLTSLGRWNRPRNYLLIAIAWIAFTQGSDSMADARKQFSSYSIPASSMTPGLMVGDYLLCWRNYYSTHAPQYGDIAVFIKPGDRNTSYVKRIVGLPGDRIRLRNAQLFVNEVAIPQEPEGGSNYTELLPNGRAYHVGIQSREHFTENTPTYTVPAGHYFVLGDNRNNSADSRFVDEIGFIPQASLRDKGLFILWSKDFSRIGLTVQ